MDEITLLRSVRSEVAAPTGVATAAGRRALTDRIGGGRHGRSHRPLWVSGIGIAALGLTATLVLTDVVGLGGWRGGAEPAAAAVLRSAAAAAIKTSDPVVGPGQYLKVSTDAVYGAFNDDGGYLATQDGQLYVPADRADDWVWVRDPSTVAQTFGPASERAAEADGDDGTTEVVRAPKGAFYNGQPQDEGLAALPRDPTRLLNHIYRVTLGAGVSRDGEALVFIADTLRTGVVPADLRAALYDAAAQIPGVELIDREANLDGRTGVALGRTESDGIRQEIIIDPATGQLIGERQVLTRADIVPGWPAGTPEGYTAITTTVVDSAPTGGSVCGGTAEPAEGAGSGICQG